MLNRRNFLALGGLVAGGAVLSPPLLALRAGAADLGARRTGAASTGPFQVRMPVPQTLRPVRSSAAGDAYQIDIRPADVEILPGVTTPALTYNGSFVGPTIRAKTGRPVTVTFRNWLDMPANVHLHGGHTPASSDGHPMDVIEPGQSRVYEYPNAQRGATLWYHDHSHHMEAEHVYRGLHGFYLIDDDAEKGLRLPSGAFDVPILIRNAQIDETGALVFGNPAERTVLTANGKAQPYFPVFARKYRLRLLNGSTEGSFTLGLDGVQFTQISSDGGLLPEPVPRTQLTLSAGERTDVVVDFSRHTVGTRLVLSDATAGPIVRFDVVGQASDLSLLPDELRPLPALGTATVEREVTLSFDMSGSMPVGLVNGQPYDPNRNDFQIKRGSTEIWRVVNGDTAWGFPHNFHLHQTSFRVLERDGGAPTLDDAGLKDTLPLAAGSVVRLQATFNDYVGRYVYHCHFLEHSSLGMMGQMEIVP
ncbi:multicopper oxidase family protein [Microbispora sp. GKU 823]|uniref:multicopper oxidase family protein n=1 Tax=Microbispora sp. GKU 823 TaxID=1652100 RepID=UPI0009A27789|nr:multicopper oxidase family protein [Microbispora sp. GKU 823]